MLFGHNGKKKKIDDVCVSPHDLVKDVIFRVACNCNDADSAFLVY